MSTNVNLRISGWFLLTSQYKINFLWFFFFLIEKYIVHLFVFSIPEYYLLAVLLLFSYLLIRNHLWLFRLIIINNNKNESNQSITDPIWALWAHEKFQRQLSTHRCLLFVEQNIYVPSSLYLEYVKKEACQLFYVYKAIRDLSSTSITSK